MISKRSWQVDSCSFHVGRAEAMACLCRIFTYARQTQMTVELLTRFYVCLIRSLAADQVSSLFKYLPWHVHGLYFLHNLLCAPSTSSGSTLRNAWSKFIFPYLLCNLRTTDHWKYMPTWLIGKKLMCVGFYRDLMCLSVQDCTNGCIVTFWTLSSLGCFFPPFNVTPLKITFKTAREHNFYLPNVGALHERPWFRETHVRTI